MIARGGGLDVLAYALCAIAGWSLGGMIVALLLDDTAGAWDFWFALVGSGLTLLAIEVLEGRGAR